QAQKRMRRHSREKRLRPRVAKTKIGNRVCRRQSSQPKSRQQKRMSRKNVNRSQHFRRENLPVSRKRFHQPPPTPRIATECLSHLPEIPIEKYHCPIIQRMRQRGRRVNPLEAAIGEGKCAEKWRACRERMHSGPEVVAKTRQRQFECPRRPA